MRTRVAISSSEWRDYAFILPIAALFWRDLVGYEPLLMLAETEEYWRAQGRFCPVALDAMRCHEFDVRFVGHVEGYETERIGQNARHFACCYDLPDDDWIMYSDADLIPLQRGFYHQHGSKPVALYYANGNHYQDFPTCHMTAQVETWREINRYSRGLIAPQMKALFDAYLPPSTPPETNGFKRWMFDQSHHSMKILAWDIRQEKLQKIERRGHPPVDRICRSVPETWDKPLNGSWVDCHVWKAPDSGENWPRIRRLIAHYLPKELAWADTYTETFRNSYAD